MCRRSPPEPQRAFRSPEARRERERERSRPRPGDPFYVHLADLRDALADILTGASGTWLDYGSDTSPYRELLAAAELRTADLPSAGARCDYPLDEAGVLPRDAAESFDGVLSTQVVEHVPDARRYLAEAYRVLKPGGRLVLTTHGVWEDHPGPLDLRRWTVDGLARDVRAAGFDVTGCWGLTCRRRAALFLFQQQFLGRAELAPVRSALDRASDRMLSGERRLSPPDARLYLGIALTARSA